jgi:ATP-dependent DNA ligase
LARSGKPLLNEPLVHRREILERFFAGLGAAHGVRLTPCTRKRRQARSWLNTARVSLDGVIAKQLDLPYLAGERAMLKVKRLRTADCVVGGFRYASGGRLVGSLLLGLYDTAKLLHHVGFTSSISDQERPALTKRLERLIAPPGFTGDAPGGPSRWSTERSAQWEPLRPELVVEVRYDHVTGRRFRHGTRFIRWRPDKAPGQCTFDQLDRPGRRA